MISSHQKKPVALSYTTSQKQQVDEFLHTPVVPQWLSKKYSHSYDLVGFLMVGVLVMR